MARRTKEEAEATRQQILDSAERVFAAKGVAHSTMADIAADAGVSRGAVYWHFTSKTDVFHAMLTRQHDANKVVCAAAQNSAEPDPLGQMRYILVHFLRKVVHDPQQRRVNEILHHKCELAGELGDLRHKLQDTLSEIERDIAISLGNAVSRGQLPTDLELPRAAIVIHAYIHGLIDNWLLHPDSYPLDREAEALVDALLDMLRFSPALRHPA
ncbi:MAG TPA: TetR family transcriptional regulator [Pseudomonas sp.]|nr:TetR family transcriptional regulator [Pseudomonas sp.]